eukprot:1794401-Lingulodinium_polyedra.AAC.1
MPPGNGSLLSLGPFLAVPRHALPRPGLPAQPSPPCGTRPAPEAQPCAVETTWPLCRDGSVIRASTPWNI